MRKVSLCYRPMIATHGTSKSAKYLLEKALRELPVPTYIDVAWLNAFGEVGVAMIFEKRVLRHPLHGGPQCGPPWRRTAGLVSPGVLCPTEGTVARPQLTVCCTRFSQHCAFQLHLGGLCTRVHERVPASSRGSTLARSSFISSTPITTRLNAFFAKTWPAMEAVAQDVIVQAVLPAAKKAIPKAVQNCGWDISIEANFGPDAPFLQNISAKTRINEKTGRRDLDIMVDLVVDLKESEIKVQLLWEQR